MKHVFAVAVLTWVVLLAVSGSEAQAQHRFDDLAFEYINVLKGLPDNYLVDVMQDSRGLVWFGTDHVLVKYDGRTFETIRDSDVNAFYKLAESADGRIWMLPTDPYAPLKAFDLGSQHMDTFEVPMSVQAEYLMERAFVGFDGDYAWFEIFETDAEYIARRISYLRWNTVTQESVHFHPQQANLPELGISGWGYINPEYAKRQQTHQIVGNGLVSFTDTHIAWMRHGELKAFQPDGGPFGPHNPITDLLPLSGHQVAVASRQALALVDVSTQETVRTVALPPEGAETSSVKLFRSNSGEIWVQRHGLWIYPADLSQPPAHLRAASPPLQNLEAGSRALLDDGHGIWLISPYGNLSAWDYSRQSLVPIEDRSGHPDAFPFNSMGLTAIFQDRSGIVWIGSLSGGVKIGPADRTLLYPWDKNLPVETVKDENISSMQPLSESLLQISTVEGHVYLLKGDQTLVRLPLRTPVQPGLNYDEPQQGRVPSLLRSVLDGNVLWLGTHQNGLIRVELDADMSRIVNERVFFPPTANRPYGKTLYSLKFDTATGTVIGGTPYGVWTLDTGTLESQIHRVDPASDDVSSNLVGASMVDSQNRVWFMRPRGLGVAMYDPSTQAITPFLPGDIGDDNPDIWGIADDTRGNLWLMTDHSRIRLKSEERITFEPLTLRSVQEMGNLVKVKQDTSDHRYWLASQSSGLYLVDIRADSVLRILDVGTGLNSNSVNAVRQLNDSLLVAHTFTGIHLVNLHSGRVAFYGADQGVYGLNGGMISITPAVLNDSTYVFSFGKGFGILNPAVSQPDPSPPQLSVKQIRINTDRSLYYPGNGSTLTLSHHENSLRFELSAAHYADPRLNQFRYRLREDDPWSEASSVSTVSLLGLAPGDYRFEWTAANKDGVWQAEPFVLHLTINPPWWATWWFRALMVAIVIAAALRWAAGQRRYKAILEERVRQRTKTIEEKNASLRVAMDDLKATQDQLIQQEKLASLGQLTAGIAHEIKNPLNFVTNFSSVSTELLDETTEAIKTEVSSSTAGDQAVSAPPWTYILDDLASVRHNLEKIHEHGSRADRIVKSMLQHSRAVAGEKAPADLNQLVREFTNLSFHGMRAGAKHMNCDLVFDLDENIGEVPLVAQDFSRVILNMTANAFDAMYSVISDQKSVNSNQTEAAGASPGGTDPGAEKARMTRKEYVPKLTLRTQREGKRVQLMISDNGPGMPEDVRNKIFQPFFTTKKGTEGTGLGLSISHDIILAHGGQVQVHSEPGEGTRFEIWLPG